MKLAARYECDVCHTEIPESKRIPITVIIPRLTAGTAKSDVCSATCARRQLIKITNEINPNTIL